MSVCLTVISLFFINLHHPKNYEIGRILCNSTKQSTDSATTDLPGEFALVANASGQRFHFLPVLCVEFLLEFGDLGVVRSVESGLTGVAGSGQQLFQTTAQCRTVRQLDFQLQTVMFAAQRRQLLTVSLPQTRQLNTTTHYDYHHYYSNNNKG